MARSLKDAIQVEWVSVRYRSVWVLTFVLTILILGGGGAWFYLSRFAPRRQAEAAIEQAELRLAEATAVRGEQERLDEIRDSARVSLEEARSEFRASHWSDAAVAARRSENLSLKALSLVRGDARDSHQVRFYQIEGDVRVKPAGAFAWTPAESRVILHVGDQVKTSASASARLIYFDGTVTTIQPGSLVEIRDLFEDPVTKVRRVRERLNWGEIQASTEQRNVQGSYHEVSTAKVTARAENAGDFRVAFDEERHTSIVDVFDGRIEVSTPSRKETLDAGERLRSGADGHLSAKQSLPGVPRLLNPADQRVFIFENPTQDTINLGWEPVSGGNRYRLMIASGSLFARPLYDAERRDLTAVVEGVPPGSYYWRVAAISEEGLRGPFSDSRRFRVTAQHIRDRTDTEPPRLEITEFVPVGQMVIINGQTEPGASLWVDQDRVDVYDDGSFNAVVRLTREGVNRVTVVAQDTAGNESSLVRQAVVELF